MSNQKEATNTSLFRILTISSLCFLFMYVGAQDALIKPDNQKALAIVLQDSKSFLCEKGIRTPLYDCFQQAGFIKKGSSHTNLSIAEQLAHLPDILSVLDKIVLPDHSSATAAKYVTLVGLLQESRAHDSSKAYKSLGQIAVKLEPAWASYPQLVVTQTCIFCGGYQSNIIEMLGNKKTQNMTAMLTMAKMHPLYFASFYHHFDNGSVLGAAKKLALLSQAGASQSAIAVGKHLNTGTTRQHLNAWVIKGLNGTRALNELPFDTVPLDTRILAWQSGVLKGYDNIELTEHLLSKGYRPAMRWLVWMNGTPLNYLRSWSYERNAAKYNALLNRYTSFGHLSGDSLSDFYSENWSNLFWNAQKEKWVMNL